MRSWFTANWPLSPFGWLATILAIIGALNWGFVGLFNFNFVRSLFGPMSGMSRFIYTLVGISGLYLLLSFLWMTSERRYTPSRAGFTGWPRWWR